MSKVNDKELSEIKKKYNEKLLNLKAEFQDKIRVLREKKDLEKIKKVQEEINKIK